MTESCFFSVFFLPIFGFFLFQMIQSIQVLRFHLLELEKVRKYLFKLIRGCHFLVSREQSHKSLLSKRKGKENFFRLCEALRYVYISKKAPDIFQTRICIMHILRLSLVRNLISCCHLLLFDGFQRYFFELTLQSSLNQGKSFLLLKQNLYNPIQILCSSFRCTSCVTTSVSATFPALRGKCPLILLWTRRKISAKAEATAILWTSIHRQKAPCHRYCNLMCHVLRPNATLSPRFLMVVFSSSRWPSWRCKFLSQHHIII